MQPDDIKVMDEIYGETKWEFLNKTELSLFLSLARRIKSLTAMVENTKGYTRTPKTKGPRTARTGPGSSERITPTTPLDTEPESNTSGGEGADR